MIVIFRSNNATRFQLDPSKSYEFCIHDFACIFPRSVTKLLTHGTFLALESNLVAKSSVNPCQSIMFFEFDANKIWQSVKPSFQSFDSLGTNFIGSLRYQTEIHQIGIIRVGFPIIQGMIKIISKPDTKFCKFSCRNCGTRRTSGNGTRFYCGYNGAS